MRNPFLNCRDNTIAASRAASAALGYQSMIKQWLSERIEQELRDRGVEMRNPFLNCRDNTIAASRAASAALGYQSMIKQWLSERIEQELRDRGNK